MAATSPGCEIDVTVMVLPVPADRRHGAGKADDHSGCRRQQRHPGRLHHRRAADADGQGGHPEAAAHQMGRVQARRRDENADEIAGQ